MLVCTYLFQSFVYSPETFEAEEDCIKKDTLNEFNQQAKRMTVIMKNICSKIPLPPTAAEKKAKLQDAKAKAMSKGKSKANDEGMNTDKMPKIEPFQSSSCVEVKDVREFQATANQLNLMYETMLKSVNGAIVQRIKNMQAKQKGDEAKEKHKQQNAAANKKYTQQGYKTGAQYGFSTSDMKDTRNQLQGIATKGKGKDL